MVVFSEGDFTGFCLFILRTIVYLLHGGEWLFVKDQCTFALVAETQHHVALDDIFFHCILGRAVYMNETAA